jgi:hypothetical protein
MEWQQKGWKMNQIIIHSPNDSSNVRLCFSEYRGKQRIDLRTYFLAEDGEWKPTRKGVSLPAEKIPDLIQALQSINCG